VNKETYAYWKDLEAQCSNLPIERSVELIDLEILKQLMRIADVLEARPRRNF